MISAKEKAHGIAVRFGGEEFMLVLSDCSQQRAMELLERTNASILSELLVKMVTSQEKTPFMALYEAEIKMRELETKLGLSPKEPS